MFVVGKDHELPTFDKAAKMSYCLINRKVFPMKHTVSLLNRLELLRIVRDRAPLSSNVMLQNCSYGDVRGVTHYGRRSIGFGYDNNVALYKAFLLALKAEVASLVQHNLVLPCLVNCYSW